MWLCAGSTLLVCGVGVVGIIMQSEPTHSTAMGGHRDDDKKQGLI